MDDPEWTCKIDEGPAGVAFACFAPDGRHVLTWADFNVRLTVWSLLDKSAMVQFSHPKAAGTQSVAFTADGRFMALAERRECKDYVHVVACDSWTSALRFSVDTQDLAALQFAPSGLQIAVWDTPLAGYKVLAYTLDGRLAGKFSPYEAGLGVKTARWSPSGHVLAVGSFDRSARLLNSVTWSCVADLEHDALVDSPPSAVIFEEVEEVRGSEILNFLYDMDRNFSIQLDEQRLYTIPNYPWTIDQAPASTSGREDEAPEESRSRYVVRALPFEMPSRRAPADRANPKIGVGTVQWSASGRYLATVNENLPTAVWLWDAQHLQLTSLVQHRAPIRQLAWDPESERLLITTGSGKVYLWTPEGASCVHIPLPNFRAVGCAWCADGKAFLLRDKEGFTVCFLGGEGL